MNPSQRQPDESFAEYKARMKMTKRLEHRYLRGEGRDPRVTRLFRPTYDDITAAIAAKVQQREESKTEYLRSQSPIKEPV